MTMDKQNEISENMLEKNVESMVLDPKTKALLVCRAKLDDIYNTVRPISDDAFNRDESYSEAFENAWIASKKALDNILINIMSYNMSDYDYKTM